MENSNSFETGCCPRLKTDEWQEKQITFTNKLFYKDHVTSIFHIPLNFSKVMERSMAKIEAAGVKCKDQLVLADEKSAWGSDVLIAIDKELPGASMERLTGNFLTKVFEGPYSEMGKFIDQMRAYVKKNGRKLKKFYFFYPYCPKCAKAYGKNYIVILAQV